MRAYLYLLLFFLAGSFAGCKQEVENLTPKDLLEEYLPLKTGKYITYQLDSLVFTESGQKEERHVYQEKLVIDAPVTDNLGRKGFRIYRFIRDSAGKKAWVSAGTNAIVLQEDKDLQITNSIEYIENNLRFVKLAYPIIEGRVWKGNGFLPTDPYKPEYDFSSNSFHTKLSTWDFTYGPKDETITLNGATLNNVLTIFGPDETHNPGISNPNEIGQLTLFIEKYAKGIGMVYQEKIMWDYQPKLNAGGIAYKVGFGVKRSMIDHN